MFVATNRLFVPPEKAAEFEERFTYNMRNYLPGVAGLRRSTLLRPTAEGQPYLSVNEFDTEEQFRAWVESDSFREAHEHTRHVARHVTGNAVETFECSKDMAL